MASGIQVGLSLAEAVVWNVGTFDVDANGKVTSGLNHEDESTDVTRRGGPPRSSEEAE